MNTAFPTADTRRHAWRPLIMAAMTWLSDVGDGNVKFNEIIAHIENLPGFPGWATWGDYNGKANQMGRRFVSLEATVMKKEGVLTSPRRGTYRLASEALVVDAPETPVVEPAVAHKAVLAVVPDPEPEIKATEPVEATVAEGPATHPAYLANERARMIAIEQTRCFGFYSDRAKTCDSCPLAGLCFAARGGKVAEANTRAADAKAAAEAAAEAAAAAVEAAAAAVEAAAEAAAAAEAPEAPEAPEAAAVEAPEAAAVEAPEAVPVAGRCLSLPFAVVCSYCGDPTEANTHVVSIEGKGTYHMGCATHAV